MPYSIRLRGERKDRLDVVYFETKNLTQPQRVAFETKNLTQPQIPSERQHPKMKKEGKLNITHLVTKHVAWTFLQQQGHTN